jgi:general stress protein CsbA
MIGVMLVILLAKITFSKGRIVALSIIYYGEVLALLAFGAAWIVAGKRIRLFVDEEEALHLF